MGNAPLICTEAARIELPGPGRAEPTSAVRMPVTMPAAAWLSPGPASVPASPKAAAQARTSPACNVRSVDAESPTVISPNVLFSTEGMVMSRGLTRRRCASLPSKKLCRVESQPGNEKAE
jgi:hypothetical protein